MKRLHFLIAGILFLVASCSKEEEEEAAADKKGITTSWKETDYYYSIGGPAIWKPTAAGEEETIRFKNNNVFYSSVHTEWNRYRISEPDSDGIARLKLYTAGNRDTTYWFIKTVTPETIEIGFGGCIEGCGKRFSRITD